MMKRERKSLMLQRWPQSNQLLFFLRRAFQKEQDVLLSELKDAQEKLEKPNELRSRWDSYARPWSMIAFAVFILVVRYLKHHNFITTHGFADQVLDMSIMGILGFSQIVPLFYRDITHRPKEIIVLREESTLCERESNLFKRESNHWMKVF
jgi:hypothetical protein